jgi:hypothetical protein
MPSPTRPEPVNSKHDFVKRYLNGEFGNRAPTWSNISLFFAGDYKRESLYHIRNRKIGADTWYNVLGRNVPAVWESALREGHSPRDLYISAMAPTEKTLIQGEVQQSYKGDNLYYTEVAKPMRIALEECSKSVDGIAARTILRYYLNAVSMDWLEHLISSYPDHVVEFSTYSTCWGTLEGYNTVFWEVRNY